MDLRDTDLPGAETLKEKVQSEAPHHRREEDAHQRQTLDPLPTAQLQMQNSSHNLPLLFFNLTAPQTFMMM